MTFPSIDLILSVITKTEIGYFIGSKSRNKGNIVLL